MNHLQGKVALVTGSSGGISQAIAIRLAKEGSQVFINYRSNPKGAEETLKAIQDLGLEEQCTQYCDHEGGYAIDGDLGMIEDVQRLVQQRVVVSNNGYAVG